MDIDHPNDYSQAWTIANMFSDVNELDDEDDEDCHKMWHGLRYYKELHI